LYLSFTPYTLHVINQLKCYLKIKVAKKVKIAIGRWYNSHFGPEYTRNLKRTKVS
jgi:hypothetical protein